MKQTIQIDFRNLQIDEQTGCPIVGNARYIDELEDLGKRIEYHINSRNVWWACNNIPESAAGKIQKDDKYLDDKEIVETWKSMEDSNLVIENQNNNCHLFSELYNVTIEELRQRASDKILEDVNGVDKKGREWTDDIFNKHITRACQIVILRASSSRSKLFKKINWNPEKQVRRKEKGITNLTYEQIAIDIFLEYQKNKGVVNYYPMAIRKILKESAISYKDEIYKNLYSNEKNSSFKHLSPENKQKEFTKKREYIEESEWLKCREQLINELKSVEMGVHQAKNGKWYVDYHDKGDIQHKVFKSKKQAKEWLAANAEKRLPSLEKALGYWQRIILREFILMEDFINKMNEPDLKKYVDRKKLAETVDYLDISNLLNKTRKAIEKAKENKSKLKDIHSEFFKEFAAECDRALRGEKCKYIIDREKNEIERYKYNDAKNKNPEWGIS